MQDGVFWVCVVPFFDFMSCLFLLVGFWNNEGKSISEGSMKSVGKPGVSKNRDCCARK